jgi:hypothetical protein
VDFGFAGLYPAGIEVAKILVEYLIERTVFIQVLEFDAND